MVRRRREGRAVRVTVPKASPTASTLRALCLQTVSLGPALAREALSGERVVAALVFGSIAAGTETETSALDLLVVGRASRADLAPYIRGLGDVLDRDLRPVYRSTAEIEAALAAGSSCYGAIIASPRIPLIGDLGSRFRANDAGGPARGATAATIAIARSVPAAR